MAIKTLPERVATVQTVDFTDENPGDPFFEIGTWADIDEGFELDDGNVIGSDVNANETVWFFAHFQLMPADFVSMVSCTFKIRYQVKGPQTNSRALFGYLAEDVSGNLLLHGQGDSWKDLNITETFFISSEKVFTPWPVNNTKASWDEGMFRLHLNVQRNKGGDTNGIEIENISLFGTYEDGVEEVEGEKTHFMLIS
ncbi:MAG: hypothetical protein FVQ79_00330 [Planctomycetes bacterium]|nr:hypothetical protein [Planctomycetota bacterium]